MAAYYMNALAAVNKHTTGLRFPDLRLGAYSLNMVVQASSCCGADNFNGTWDPLSSLVLAGPEGLTNAQKRLGLMGTDPDVGTGLHRRAAFSGESAPVDNRPQILGFVFKEGKMTLFRNGTKLGTFPAHSTAFTTLSWINGWLDDSTKVTGQVAEIKAYNQAFSDSIMFRLHKLLECKWHVGTAQTDDWRTCEHAEGVGDGGGGGYTGALRIQPVDFASALPLDVAWSYGDGKLVSSVNGQADSLVPTDSIYGFKSTILMAVWADVGGSVVTDGLTISSTDLSLTVYPYETALGAFGPYNVPGARLVYVALNSTEPGHLKLAFGDEDFDMQIQAAVPEIWFSDTSGTQPTATAGFDAFFAESNSVGTPMQVSVPHVKADGSAFVGMRANKLIRNATDLTLTVPVTVKTKVGTGVSYELNGSPVTTEGTTDLQFTGSFPASAVGNISNSEFLFLSPAPMKVIGTNAREATLGLNAGSSRAYGEVLDVAHLYSVADSAAKLPGCTDCAATQVDEFVEPGGSPYTGTSTATITMSGSAGDFPTYLDARTAARNLGTVNFGLSYSGSSTTYGWSASGSGSATTANSYSGTITDGAEVFSTDDHIVSYTPITLTNVAAYGVGTQQNPCGQTGSGAECPAPSLPDQAWIPYHATGFDACTSGTGNSGCYRPMAEFSQPIATTHTQAIETRSKQATTV